jgi:alkylation response protein AidB-like acyl-CoA dehydrogenase
MSAILKFPQLVYGAGTTLSAAEDVAEALALKLAETAVARDAAGGHAAAERELIRASGLLSLTIPERFGGQEGDWPTLLPNRAPAGA